MYEQTPKKKISLKRLLAIATLVCVAAFAGAVLYQNNFSVFGPSSVSEKEFTKRPDPLNKGTQVFLIPGESFTKDTTVKLKGVQLTREKVRIFVNVNNDGNGELHVLRALSQATMVGDDGKQYKADPLAARNPTAIGPGASADIELVFPPVPADTKKIMVQLPSMFRMGEPPWDMSLAFKTP